MQRHKGEEEKYEREEEEQEEEEKKKKKKKKETNMKELKERERGRRRRNTVRVTMKSTVIFRIHLCLLNSQTMGVMSSLQWENQIGVKD